MSEGLNRQCKCVCELRCVDNWRVIRETEHLCVVYCQVCHHAWHTSARYAGELERDIASPFHWRRITKSSDFYLHEEGVDYDAPNNLEALD